MQNQPQIILGGTDYSGIPGSEITRVILGDRSMSPMIHNPVTGVWSK